MTTGNSRDEKVNKGLGSADEEMQRQVAAGGDDAQLTRTDEDVEREKLDTDADSKAAGTGTGNASGSTDDLTDD